MHLRALLSLSLPLFALSCRDAPTDLRPVAIELGCSDSWSQHLGPIDVRLPPVHDLVGTVDLTQPGHEGLLAWLRSEAAEEVTFECPDGLLIVDGYAGESAWADGTSCDASYEGTLSGTCSCSDPVEDCDNALDDDDDGRIDCEDLDCASMPHCQPPPWRCSSGDACDSDGRVLGADDPACADPHKLWVCSLDPWCCTYEWDLACATLADSLGLCPDEVPDAGVPDAPDLDAGLPDVDAAVPDAPTPDAGMPMPDAGTPMPDAGTPMPDAGMPMPDAGMPMPDAGMPMPDAGMPMHDAGMPIPDEGWSWRPSAPPAGHAMGTHAALAAPAGGFA